MQQSEQIAVQTDHIDRTQDSFVRARVRAGFGSEDDRTPDLIVRFPKIVPDFLKPMLIFLVGYSNTTHKDQTPSEELTSQDWKAIGLLTAYNNHHLGFPLLSHQDISWLRTEKYLFGKYPTEPGLAAYIGEYRKFCLSTTEEVD